MKPKLGDMIMTEVFEQAGDKSYIISIEGRLVRIVNQSSQVLKVGQKVKLIVIGINPIKLQFEFDYIRGSDRFA